MSIQVKSIGSSPTLQSKSVTPSSSTQIVLPDSGYDGLSQVTVNGDSNLTASNIKSGTRIFNVVGNLKNAREYSFQPATTINNWNYSRLSDNLYTYTTSFDISSYYDNSWILVYFAYTSLYNSQSLSIEKAFCLQSNYFDWQISKYEIFTSNFYTIKSASLETNLQSKNINFVFTFYQTEQYATIINNILNNSSNYGFYIYLYCA